MDKNEQKKMAEENLNLLGVMEECRKAFSEDGSVWCSENQRLMGHRIGVLFSLKGYTFEEECRLALKDLEKNSQNITPYHIVEGRYEFGHCFAVLFVDGNEDSDMSRLEPVNDGEYEVFAYVYNVDEPTYSEFGYICVRGAGGGVVRTA